MKSPERLEKFAAWKPQVLICHSPPLSTPLDRIKEGLHGGSRAVREFIEQAPARALLLRTHS